MQGNALMAPVTLEASGTTVVYLRAKSKQTIILAPQWLALENAIEYRARDDLFTGILTGGFPMHCLQ